ncbi:MAG: TonB-dependent receptor [Bacteroidota bacterium]
MSPKRYLFLAGLFCFCLLSGQTELKSQTDNPAISGIIKEAKSGEAVIGVSVTLIPEKGVKSKIRGAVSNKFGFYSIPDIEPADYKLRVKAIGFAVFEQKISVSKGKDLRFDIKLKQEDIKTQEVVVESQKESSPTSSISAVSVSPDFIHQIPSIAGERDIFRVLQLLPGVKQSSELSSGLYVRGGSPDQNLTLLDGVIVYNPSHLAGFLSVFNNDAIRDVKLIKGAFPAEYGGRLSSVLDMTMKEGTKEKFSGSGGISLISSRLTLEGPITENSSFMISGRRTYFDLLLAIATTEDVPQYYFYDLNAKFNYKLSESDHIYASGYFGRDRLNPPDNTDVNFKVDWGNSTANLRWMHIVSPSLFTNFSLIFTDYNFDTELRGDSSNSVTDFLAHSGIKDWLLRGEAQYFPAESHVVKSGIECVWHNFASSLSSSFLENLDQWKMMDNNISGLEAALYLQDEWAITPLLSTNIGARVFYFQKGNYFRLEPRVSATYYITDFLKMKGSFAVANQYIHMIVRNDITLPTDLWFPSTERIKPSQSVQGVFGVETTFGENAEYLLSLEGYYKNMTNLYEYKDSSLFSFGIPLEDQFTSGRGEAYGIELFLNKRMGHFMGWIGYTLAWTTRTFSELNNGKSFYPRYDRRHDISVVFSYKPSESWEFGVTWVYGTGQAYTMPTGTYFMDPIGFGNRYTDPWGGDYQNKGTQYSERNGYRLPPYHRMDLNIMYNYKWFDVPFQFTLNIYNLYNRRNPFMWYIGNDWDQQTQTSVSKVKQITLFPIIPTLGLNFKF